MEKDLNELKPLTRNEMMTIKAGEVGATCYTNDGCGPNEYCSVWTNKCVSRIINNEVN